MCDSDKECRTVEPIRDMEKLKKMKEFLRKKPSRRDYTIFVLGLNSGLRIGDILRLTVEDVADGNVTIREEKTGKVKKFKLSAACIKALDEYFRQSRITSGILFPSKKRNGPVGRIQIWRSLNEAAKFAGITDNIGTHTMRKSFGFWALRNGVANIEMLMKAFNHSSQSITMRYIGITDDEMNEKLYGKMNL